MCKYKLKPSKLLFVFYFLYLKVQEYKELFAEYKNDIFFPDVHWNTTSFENKYKTCKIP